VTSGVTLSPGPIIQLQSGSGSPLTTAGVQVTVAIGSGPGTLSGTLTRVTDGQGRAEFPDLVITGDPGQRTLKFTAGGYTEANSSAIDVQAAAPSGSTSSVTAAPTSITAGATSTVTVVVRDAGNNPLGGRTVTLNGGTDPSVSPSSATTGGDGAATFTFTSSVPETKSLTAQSGGVTLGTATVTVM
jgi:adhesin/invasin